MRAITKQEQADLDSRANEKVYLLVNRASGEIAWTVVAPTPPPPWTEAPGFVWVEPTGLHVVAEDIPA